MKNILLITLCFCTLVVKAQTQTNINEINSLFSSYSSFRAVNYGDSFTPAKNLRITTNGTKLEITYELQPGIVLRKCSITLDIQKCRIDRDMFDARKLSIYSQAGIDYVENSYEKDGKKYGSQKKEMLSYWRLETGNATLTDRLINGFLSIQTATKKQKIAPTPIHPLDNAEIDLITVSFT